MSAIRLLMLACADALELRKIVVSLQHPNRRTLISGAAATLTATWLPALPAAGRSPTLSVFEVESAALDPRSYRGLQLGNGLRVLLASDPVSNKAAAAMEVRVGSMSNPEAWPGLAHFCEHMLFLGTSSFPEEGEFARFISSNGGSNGAFTSAERTVYHFDVSDIALPSALSRFADFFISPLFTSSATAREVAAIDAEHSKNLQSDFRRANQLLRLRANPAHPFSRFYTGNQLTLRRGQDGAREALLDFYDRYYHAEQMSLAVVGPQSLDELQRLVGERFGSIAASDDSTATEASALYDDMPLPFDPAGDVAAGAMPTATLVVPVQEQRSVCLTWCLPIGDLEAWRESKPTSILSLLMSARGERSLIACLKSAGLAATVDLIVEESTKRFAVLSVTIGLTKLGLARWPEAVGLVYSCAFHSYSLPTTSRMASHIPCFQLQLTLLLHTVWQISAYPQRIWCAISRFCRCGQIARAQLPLRRSCPKRSLGDPSGDSPSQPSS